MLDVGDLATVLQKNQITVQSGGNKKCEIVLLLKSSQAEEHNIAELQLFASQRIWGLYVQCTC